MPTVQRELVEKGISFQRGFVTTPLCCPSRSSLLTGNYAHTTGCLINRCAKQFDETTALAPHLKGAGYRTALVGKYLNDYVSLSPRVPRGWSRWVAFEQPGYTDYRLVIDGTVVRQTEHSTDRLAKEAVAFIESVKEGPFLLYFAPFAPHNPAEQSPLDSATAFSDLPPWRPASYNEADVSDKPGWVRALKPLLPKEQDAGDQFHKKQLRSLLAVDRAVGQILEALARTGALSSTVIFYLSDNGLSWGEHRIRDQKACPYEECLRVPFVVRAPGVTPRVEQQAMVLNIDVAPTIFEMAGVQTRREGQSLVPLMQSPGAPWRKEFLLENFTLRFHGIRTARWKYVVYPDTHEDELYNLGEDPHELDNLSDDPEHAEIIGDLKSRLKALSPGEFKVLKPAGKKAPTRPRGRPQKSATPREPPGGGNE
jgi:arylsulfatase A-like enzyme